MRSIFSGLNIAVLAMQAQRKATDVTAHNIANANTDGYSRQRAVMAATQPFSYAGAGQVGTGVIVKEIERARDGFLDYQVRCEKQLIGYWETRRDALEQIEILFMEPSETSFNTVMSRFFDAWQELSINPESSPVRTNLVETSNTLVNTVNHLNSQLDNLKTDTNETIRIKVDEINNLATQIANLNQQIIRISNRGESPNDLTDRRDLLIDQLADIIDFTVVSNQNGSTNIIFRGRDLIRESTSYKLITDYTNGADIEVYWEKKGPPENDPIKIYREESFIRRRDSLEGLFSIREEIDNIKDDFAALVTSLANLVNEQHREGYDIEGNQVKDIDGYGGDFFVQDNLNRWKVHDVITSDVSKIAAAYYEEGILPDEGHGVGNGMNALEIAKLRNVRLVRYEEIEGGEVKIRFRKPEGDETGQTTLESFYRDSISALGVKSQESIRMVENQGVLLTQLLNRRESISGVSLDEEMSNMILFQHAYQAAARMVTTLDSMLDTVINRMGVR
ncbi:MAG: flagellar hook-associated protein FlgK [Firmicutes bacterium HGW-Firmicutes-13]|nr:MAG: flagellar hook-associated protein FlgK [Firmicutes bacterium HGW-Firmicutes-13]